MSTITFISTAEAADITGVSVETIRQLCKAGTLKYQKRGQLFYPCKEDINRYADSITKVYSIKRDIERYALKLKKDKDALQLAQEELNERLNLLDMFPNRIERIQKLVYSLLRQYSENRTEEITERDVELLFMMFRGDSLKDIGNKLSLSKERARQIWINVLRKLVTVRNEIELRDIEIVTLKKRIQHLEEFVENKRFEFIPQEIVENIELLFETINQQNFTLRTKRGLINAGINTVWELVQCKRSKIRYGTSSIGMKSFQEIEKWLSERNLKFELALPPGMDLPQIKERINNK